MHALQERLSEVRRLAEAAAARPAPFRPDLDPAAFDADPREPAAGERAALERQVRAAALGAGVDLGACGRAGTFLQVDRSVVARRVAERFGGAMEIVPSGEAALALPWVEEQWWRVVPPDADRYTAAAALRQTGGFCLRVRPGERVEEPVQACLLIAETAFSQNVHNVVVVEEGAAAHLVTGCSVHRAAAGLHIGVTEVVVRRGATLTATMIHRWSPGIHARPRSTVIVEEGATYVSNYVLLGEVGSLQMFPKVVLRGRGARHGSRFACSSPRGQSSVVGKPCMCLKGAGQMYAPAWSCSSP